MASSFNYNQLNVIGRDRQSVEFWQKALTRELDRLRSEVDVTGPKFKNVVNVANEVWAGEDKELFIKNLTASANEFSNSIATLRENINKYLQQDLSAFDSLQASTRSIATKQ